MTTNQNSSTHASYRRISMMKALEEIDKFLDEDAHDTPQERMADTAVRRRVKNR